MSDFFEQYKRPEWQRKRLEVMEAAGFRCQECDTGEATLNVHHKLYVRGRKPWEYTTDELECLCEPCHKKNHERRDELKQLVGKMPSHLVDQILGYARAVHVYDIGDGVIEVRSYEQAIGVAERVGIKAVQAYDVINLVSDGWIETEDLDNLCDYFLGAPIPKPTASV